MQKYMKEGGGETSGTIGEIGHEEGVNVIVLVCICSLCAFVPVRVIKRTVTLILYTHPLSFLPFFLL